MTSPVLKNLSSSLYCGDLRKDVTEAMLYRIFNAVGTVSSIRVCRDAVSRQSLGYAYINFASRAHAQRALDSLNFTAIKNKPCRLGWSQRDPNKRKGHSSTNLYIKNLHPNIDNKTLLDTFSMFGEVSSSKVATDMNGNSRGYGFVNYTTKDAADKALQRVNGMEIAGKKVMVIKCQPQKHTNINNPDEEWRNLYMRFPTTWNEEKLQSLCEEFGEVDIYIKKNESGVSRGFGFANFKEHDSAVKCVEALNGKKFGEVELMVCRHRSKSERLGQKIGETVDQYAGLNLYVKNLPDPCDDEKLRSLFEAYGNITSAKVMTSQDQKSRGFGFVCFETKEMAAAAIKGMHSKVVENKPLVVCLAERKEKRQARFKSQSQNLEYQARFRPIRQPGKAQHTNSATAFPPPHHYPVNIQNPMPFGGYPQPGMRQPMMQGRGVFNPQARQSPFTMAQPMGVPGMHQARPGFQPQIQQFNSRPQQMMAPPMNSMPYSAYGSVPQQQQMSMMHYRTPPSVGKPKPVNKRQQHAELIAHLASLNKTEAKQVLGEKLFTEIAKFEKHSAGKITGMLLELDNAELVGLLEDPAALNRKIAEALNVLQRHLGQTPAE